VITAEFAEFYLVNSYTRNKGQNLKFTTERDSFDANMTAHLAALKETAEGKGKYVIYGGDLNVAHLDIDVYDGTTNKQRKKSAGFTPEERATFSNLLEDGMDVYERACVSVCDGVYVQSTFHIPSCVCNKFSRVFLILQAGWIPSAICTETSESSSPSMDDVPMRMAAGSLCEAGDWTTSLSISRPSRK
jgi:hypothetical protein